MELTLRSLAAYSALLYLLYGFVSFSYYYIRARRTGYPIFIAPVFSRSVLYMTLGAILRPQLEKYLPEWIYVRLDMALHGWEFRRRGNIRQLVGGADVFVIVTLDHYMLVVGNPTLANTILQRRKDFISPPSVIKFVGIFGGNVLQSNGEDWQRQRRIIAPNLNESIMGNVWKESCSQAQDMLDYMVEHPGGETLEGLRSIAINVLGKAGYGHGMAWSPDFAKSLDGDNGNANASDGDWSEGDARVAYFKTIALVSSMFFSAVLIPNNVKKLFFMPKSFRFLGFQMENVPRYIKEIFDAETKRETTTNQTSASRNNHNMLDMLLKYSNQEKNPSGLFLTDDEVSGNLWIFTAAGFDTTANTMGYAVTLLAAYPEYQEWVREELRNLDADMSQWKYQEVFSRCPRILAIMYETMRLYSPIHHAYRQPNGSQQVVDANGTHTLPADMDIYVSQQTIHYDETIWGADVGEFRPQRWLEKGSDNVEQVIKINNLKDVPFLPWSSGPRACPGTKMSQVEFTAALATLFRHARCEPLPVQGVTEPEELRRRLMRTMEESISELTLRMKNPTEVQLRWVRD